jgi:hypothetical protein
MLALTKEEKSMKTATFVIVWMGVLGLALVRRSLATLEAS